MFPTILSQLFYQQIRRVEAHSSRIYGPLIGLVTDNKDPERLARVKVMLPTISSKLSTMWAPMPMLGAGKNSGWSFIPQIDDEVVVMFEHGDIGRPVVIGVLWNGKDGPPEVNDTGKNPRSSFMSREGSKITFNDANGTVKLEDGGGAGKFILHPGGIIAFSLLNDVTVKAPEGSVNVVAKDFNAEALDKLHIEAGGDIKMSSDGKIDIKGRTMCKVQGAQVGVQPGSAPQARKVELTYQISKGDLTVKDGASSYSLSATSGRGEHMNNPLSSSIKNKGPIPPGNYQINSGNISDPGFTGDVLRSMRGDWGDWRVPLDPVSGTNTLGRDGFFIHGGKLPGSAGCIDIGGGLTGNANTDRLLESLMGDADGKIPVKVIP